MPYKLPPSWVTKSGPVPFRVIITGGRSYAKWEEFISWCDSILADKVAAGRLIEVVEGGQRNENDLKTGQLPASADLFAEQYAKLRDYRWTPMEADWKYYGRRAGPIRNQAMAKYAVANGVEHCGCIAFWNKKSKGTKNMITLAKLYKIPTRKIYTRY